MQPLEPAEQFLLSAVQGWLELGNLPEARVELAQLSPESREHPLALEMHWAVRAQAREWAEALAVARRLIERAPGHSVGWVHAAYAARRAPGGGVQAAWDALHPALEKFPQEVIIPYNLACYACQLQHLVEARKLVRRAIKTGSLKVVKDMALRDADLEPLWPEIREL